MHKVVLDEGAALLHSQAMRLRSALLGSLTLCLALPLQSRVTTMPRSRMDALPRTTVWAWERREDLRTLNPRTTAVAYLVATLTQDGPILRHQRQRNALFIPPDTVRIAVVRVETHQPVLTQQTAQKLAAQLASIATASQAAAFQIDFDAMLSERAWYREVLQQTRKQMPAAMPLSITALASWCADDRWMQGLPIDEAVPMLFRMEPGMRNHPNISIREPLCRNSVGISTRETWPQQLAGKRIYIFPDAGWHQDDLTQTLKALP